MACPPFPREASLVACIMLRVRGIDPVDRDMMFGVYVGFNPLLFGVCLEKTTLVTISEYTYVAGMVVDT